MTRYNLVIDGVPSGKFKTAESQPASPAGKPGRVWMEFVDNRNPPHDALTHKLGPEVRSVVAGKSVWMRELVALTVEEIDAAKDQDAQAGINGRAMKAFVKALDKGTIMPGANVGLAAIRAAIKAEM